MLGWGFPAPLKTGLLCEAAEPPPGPALALSPGVDLDEDKATCFSLAVLGLGFFSAGGDSNPLEEGCLSPEPLLGFAPTLSL